MSPGRCTCGRGDYIGGGVCTAGCANPEGPARRFHRLRSEYRQAQWEMRASSAPPALPPGSAHQRPVPPPPPGPPPPLQVIRQPSQGSAVQTVAPVQVVAPAPQQQHQPPPPGTLAQAVWNGTSWVMLLPRPPA
eukprot:303362-Alexandrium_andersonii.AAC.1